MSNDTLNSNHYDMYNVHCTMYTFRKKSRISESVISVSDEFSKFSFPGISCTSVHEVHVDIEALGIRSLDFFDRNMCQNQKWN